ncbi:MAG: hypothetical protein AAGA55_04160 [Planctomycetota bacterium]
MPESDDRPTLGFQPIDRHRFERGRAYLHRWLVSLGVLGLVGVTWGVAVFWADPTVLFAVLLAGSMIACVVLGSYRHAKHAAVEIDYDRGMIRLERFRYPLTFLDIRRKAAVEFAFDELLGIEVFHGKGQTSAIVHTRSSRFSLNETIERFDEVVARIRDAVPNDSGLPVRRRFVVLGFFAGLLGLGASFFIAWLVGWI